MREVWAKVWSLLPKAESLYEGDLKLRRAAYARARFVVGVTVKLLGMPLPGVTQSEAQTIDEEVAAIEKAQGERRPPALGESDPDFIGFDYTLFRPAGFYANSATLGRYFRAIRWLQLVPFRVEKREEYLALHTIAMSTTPEASSFEESWAVQRQLWNYEDTLKTLLGPPDDWGLVTITSGSRFTSSHVEDKFFDDARIFALAAAKEHPESVAKLNDRLKEPTPQGIVHPEYRLLSAHRLPEQEVMAAMKEITSSASAVGGLEFDAWLRFPLARDLLVERGDGARASFLTEHPPDPSAFVSYGPHDQEHPWWELIFGDHFYPVALRLTSTLRYLGEVDPRAPDFMRQRPWQLKTLQTAAASWAQYRHAFILQAKSDISLYGGASNPTGFLEPVPRFYARLGTLAQIISSLAAQADEKCDPVEELADQRLELASDFRKAAHGKMTDDEVQDLVIRAGDFYQLAPGEKDARGLLPPPSGKDLAAYEAEANKPWQRPSAAVLNETAGRIEADTAQLHSVNPPGSAAWQQLRAHRMRLDHCAPSGCRGQRSTGISGRVRG